jgi:hypothetical protein
MLPLIAVSSCVSWMTGMPLERAPLPVPFHSPKCTLLPVPFHAALYCRVIQLFLDDQHASGILCHFTTQECALLPVPFHAATCTHTLCPSHMSLNPHAHASIHAFAPGFPRALPAITSTMVTAPNLNPRL